MYLVVPSGNDTLPSDWYAGRDGRLGDTVTQPPGRTHTWPPSCESEWEIANIQSNEQFSPTQDNSGDQGLYWLWDMSWNGAGY